MWTIKKKLIVLSGEGETICRHSIYNELESDSGKSMLIKFEIKFLCNSSVLESVSIFLWQKTNTGSVTQYQGKVLQDFLYLVRAYIPTERKRRQPVHERKNKYSLSKCSPSPHLLPLSVFTPLPARLQMANAIFDVFSFAHQTRGHSCTVPKPAADVSAQLPDNQRRWNTSLRLEVKSTKKNPKKQVLF